MHQGLLVGVNATAGSWQALEQALAAAETQRTRVVALLVEPPGWTPAAHDRAMYEAVVRTEAQRRARLHCVPLEFRVRQGFPARTIADQARVLGSAAIVLGHSDDSVFHRWSTASVSDLVRRQAPCPTLVVGPGTPMLPR